MVLYSFLIYIVIKYNQLEIGKKKHYEQLKTF